MKDAYTVLRQKERDAKRVRKEIESLLTVIPLLTEEASSSVVPEMIRDGNRKAAEDTSMLELERYYPFVRNLRK